MMNLDNLMMKSRNVFVGGRRTSLRMEGVFWDALDAMCVQYGCTPCILLTELERRIGRLEACRMNLTAAVRLLAVMKPVRLDTAVRGDQRRRQSLDLLFAGTPFQRVGKPPGEQKAWEDYAVAA